MIVIGAGFGGLTTAAMLAQAGLDVTVLEAHIYPGGCAGTFYYHKFLFDAGATVAAGFTPGGPLDQVASQLGISWSVRPTETAMVVHLPGAPPIPLPTDRDAWRLARLAAFGQRAETFWRWQERTADLLWSFALQLPPWPPESRENIRALADAGRRTFLPHLTTLPDLVLDAVRPVRTRLAGQSERLRQFVDAQLLIASQATSDRANALFGASALDLAQRGVVHPEGGMVGLAQTLVESIRQNGGRVLFRREATRVVVANLPTANVATLLGDQSPRLRSNSPPSDGWGAFTLYVGIDASAIPADLPLHHQVVRGQPLGEGNSIFLSISPAWDESRAPAGHRAITISTHTTLAPWWTLWESDRAAYDARKDDYTNRILDVAATVLPGIRAAATLNLPGTPITFQRYTRRVAGWVGGFPQTSLTRARGPRHGPNLWLVGDSIFPGQSTAAVALGGLRVAREILGTPIQSSLSQLASQPPFSFSNILCTSGTLILTPSRSSAS